MLVTGNTEALADQTEAGEVQGLVGLPTLFEFLQAIFKTRKPHSQILIKLLESSP